MNEERLRNVLRRGDGEGTGGIRDGVEFAARVRRVALLGTGLQLACTGILAGGFGLLLGWSAAASLYLGTLVALSSTVVILKTLPARGEMDSVHGTVLLGMLIVQDLSAVAFLVMLPALTADSGSLLPTLALAMGKAILFIGAPSSSASAWCRGSSTPWRAWPPMNCSSSPSWPWPLARRCAPPNWACLPRSAPF